MWIVKSKDTKAESNTMQLAVFLSVLLIVYMYTSINLFRIGIVKPLNHFLNTEFGQVNVTKKAFHKSHSRVTQLVEKLCQVCSVYW